ncbi:unnamed protein product, partial [Heterobilharzia americana]
MLLKLRSSVILVKHFYLHHIPFWAFTFATVGSLLVYIIAVSYDHVQPVVPFLSQLAIYPPEKYVFWFFSTIYAILVIFSQWIWCAVVRRKMKRSLQSRILFVLVDLTALLMTISGMFILGLTYIDTLTNNVLHYNLTIANFVCHVSTFTISVVITAFVFEDKLSFCAIRLIALLVMLFSSIDFDHYCYVGLQVLDANDFHYIKEYESGYEEFKWCAISEWIMTFDAYAIHILQGLEIGEISKSLIHSMSKSTLNKNKR